MSTTVEEWAARQAGHELQEAKLSGLSPVRQWHYGRAAVLLMTSGTSAEVPDMLAAGLRQTGAHGTQFVAGLRSALTMVDGARGMQAMDEAENVEAWTEGDRDAAAEADSL